MAIPPRIRVNVAAPFPSLVTGNGPIGIGKNNGIWTVFFNMGVLAPQSPSPANYTTDFLLVYDSLSQTYFRMPLSSLSTTSVVTRTQRSVTTGPIVISSADQILNINIPSGAPTCALPPSASRAGAPLTFKDVGNHFSTNSLTITPNGAETIDGASSLILNVNRSAVTLNPFNDASNSGWFIT
jgi:hypothetical protein